MTTAEVRAWLPWATPDDSKYAREIMVNEFYDDLRQEFSRLGALPDAVLD